MTRISLHGYGFAQGKPDIVKIQIRVKNENKDQKQCLHVNNEGSRLVVSTLKENNIKENDIHVHPASVHESTKQLGIIGRGSIYVATNNITATIRNLDQSGKIPQKINLLNEDLIQVCNLQFDLENKLKLENEARKLAFEDAKAKAESYADCLTSSYLLGDKKKWQVHRIEETLRYNNNNTARNPSGKFAPAIQEEEMQIEICDIKLDIDILVHFSVESVYSGG